MAMDFTKVLIRDNVFNVTDTLKYAVKKGGQNVTPTVFPANSANSGTQTYNIQVPSLNTIIDREVQWKSQIKGKVVYNLPAGYSPNDDQYPMQYGSTDALAPFPLHQCVKSMSCTINQNTITQNTDDVLPYILHMVKRKNMHRYAGMTPTAIDSYSAYSSDQSSNNNALGAFQNSLDNDWSPRGSYNLDYCTTDGVAKNGFVMAPYAGSHGNAGTYTVYFAVTVTEPLLMSPFIFGNPYSNNQGFYGIQNMNLVMNMNNGNHVWRSKAPVAGATVSSSIEGFGLSELRFMFYTAHPSLVLPTRNVVSFYEMPRFITSIDKAVGAATKVNGGIVGTPFSASTNSLPLNQISDKIILSVRKKLSAQNPTDPDFWMTFQDLNIQFNNGAGILSTANLQQLYKMSINSGSNQSWNEFVGKANVYNTTEGQSVNQVGTSGSIIMLDMATDINLTEDFFAPGSLGNFTLQINFNGVNNTEQGFAAGDLEIVVITLNSGLFVCEAGTSSIYTGILTRQDVLDASNQEAYSKSDANRMVGGGLLDNISSAAGYIKGLPSVAKKVVDIASHPCSQAVIKKMSGSGKKTKSATDNRFY